MRTHAKVIVAHLGCSNKCFGPVLIPWWRVLGHGKSQNALKMGRFGTKNGSKMGPKSLFSKMIVAHLGCSNKCFGPVLIPWWRVLGHGKSQNALKMGRKNEFAKPFDIQELATTLCSIQLDFQDIGLVDHSVIDLVNTLVNKLNPQVLQQTNNSALLSLNLLYNYNIDVAGVCALQVLINHFAIDVHTTISCDAFDSPHLYSDDD